MHRFIPETSNNEFIGISDQMPTEYLYEYTKWWIYWINSRVGIHAEDVKV